MPAETSRTYDVGRDAFGRSVTATRHTDYMNRRMWKIEIHPSSLQDDGGRIDGLSDKNLLELITAVGIR